MYNGDGVRRCSHYNNNTSINNKNTNTIFTAPKYSKVGVGVEVATESVATNNSISLSKITPLHKIVGV